MSETIERFYSLDETIRGIKEAHELDMQALKDKLMASEIEGQMLREALRVAEAERKSSERVTVKLITQFAVVEAVFAEAKALALQHHGTEDKIKAYNAQTNVPPNAL